MNFIQNEPSKFIFCSNWGWLGNPLYVVRYYEKIWFLRLEALIKIQIDLEIHGKTGFLGQFDSPFQVFISDCEFRNSKSIGRYFIWIINEVQALFSNGIIGR